MDLTTLLRTPLGSACAALQGLPPHFPTFGIGGMRWAKVWPLVGTALALHGKVLDGLPWVRNGTRRGQKALLGAAGHCWSMSTPRAAPMGSQHSQPPPALPSWGEQLSPSFCWILSNYRYYIANGFWAC